MMRRLEFKKSGNCGGTSAPENCTKYGSIPAERSSGSLAGEVVDPLTVTPSLMKLFASGSPNQPHPRILIDCLLDIKTNKSREITD